MNQKELNLAADGLVDEYQSYMMRSNPYQIKGIFHSELLMFITLAKHFGIKNIIESGRARGQSTEMIGRFAYKNDILFHSIESNNRGEDCEIAEARLKNIGISVRLHYGDSFKIMPPLIANKKTLILIDGPKGSGMIKLCQDVLNYPDVIGVCLHDSYWEGSTRAWLEKTQRGKYLISDDPEFVSKFKHLDDDCWLVNPFPPYQMGSYIKGEVKNLHPSRSYSGTLSFIQNRR